MCSIKSTKWQSNFLCVYHLVVRNCYCFFSFDLLQIPKNMHSSFLVQSWWTTQPSFCPSSAWFYRYWLEALYLFNLAQTGSPKREKQSWRVSWLSKNVCTEIFHLFQSIRTCKLIACPSVPGLIPSIHGIP